jgi:hypothetical protein
MNRKNMSMIRSFSALCVSALLLGACGGATVKEMVGLDNRAPDEFRVVSRPPLSVPPQFDLRPPSAEGVGNAGTRDRAQEVLLGAPVENTKDSSTSASDSNFLAKAGAANADPEVKQKLTEKRINEQIKKEESSWWGSLATNDKREPVVKAEGEAERIRKNQEEGKPVTEGETPETGGGTMSTLERWFGL